jgi:Na+-driven multidrug efflux pump
VTAPPEAAPPAPPGVAASADDPTPGGFWSAVREALRGSEQDYSRGPLGRSVLLLAVPMVLEMALESVFAVTDIFFVARLGPDATASVALTESLLVLVYAFAMGVGIAATALVARRTGEHDTEGASRAAGQAILVAAASAVVLGAVGAALAPQLLALMGAGPGVLRVGTGYARVMLGGEASILLLFVGNAIFRGAGDPVVAMRTLWVANGINIVLGPLLIFGPGRCRRWASRGPPSPPRSGAARARRSRSGSSPASGRRGRRPRACASAARHLRPDRPSMAALAKLAWAAGLQQVVGSANWILLVRIVALFGSVASPATASPSASSSSRCSRRGAVERRGDARRPVARARRPGARRARGVARRGATTRRSSARSGLVFVLAAGRSSRRSPPTPPSAAGRRRDLRIVAAGFVFYAYGMVLTAAFNGAGDTRTPTWLNLFAFWAFELPLAWLLAVRLGWGPAGAMVAVALAFSALAVGERRPLPRGRWKTRAV